MTNQFTYHQIFGAASMMTLVNNIIKMFSLPLKRYTCVVVGINITYNLVWKFKL